MNLGLKNKDIVTISEFIRKYEKYMNLYNGDRSDDFLDVVVKDIVENTDVDSTTSDIRNFILDSLQLSEGISIVMAPNAQFQYTDIDQVQRFQY